MFHIMLFHVVLQCFDTRRRRDLSLGTALEASCPADVVGTAGPVDDLQPESTAVLAVDAAVDDVGVVDAASPPLISTVSASAGDIIAPSATASCVPVISDVRYCGSAFSCVPLFPPTGPRFPPGASIIPFPPPVNVSAVDMRK